MEFEKENDIMDQRQEMMEDAIDDVTGLEDEEESEEVVSQVLDEIGIDLGQAVCTILYLTLCSPKTKPSGSLARRLLACRNLQCLRRVWRRQLEEATRKMMIYLHD